MRKFVIYAVAIYFCCFTACKDTSAPQSSEPSVSAAESPPVADATLTTESTPEPQTHDDATSEPASPIIDSAFTDQKIAFAFPRSIAGLDFAEHHPYPEAKMGYSIRYENEDLMKVDIYVYDNGLSGISTGHTGDEIIAEVGNAEAGIRYYEEEGVYRDVEKLGGGIHPPSAKVGDVAFQSSRYQYSQSARFGVAFTGVRASETFITGFKSHFIKVRVTYPQATSEDSIKIRDQFLQQLADLIRAS